MDARNENASTPDALIAHARARSPFYGRLYAGLPDAPTLTDLPVVDQATFWEAHCRNRREILTDTQQDGFVLNSGGTTGAPKHSYFAASEWETATRLSARSFDAAGLRDGDRVATLFASGNLYASLMFATDSLKYIQAKVTQFPVGYSTDFEAAATVIETFGVNVLAGFPTHLLRIIDALDAQGANSAVRIERILFAGELFTSDQQGFLRARFPGLQVHSAGYASVDSGAIGYAATDCTGSEHRVMDGSTIIEILDDETGAPIEEAGQGGRLVFTSLVRRLMPLIRYPTGDRAQWIEPPGGADRKFMLLGRSEEAARVGSDMIQVSEAKALLEPFRERLGIEEFQLLVTREDRHDRLCFRLLSFADAAVREAGAVEILRDFLERRADFADAVQKKIMHPPTVKWVSRGQLIVNERTGKLRRVVDRRDG